MEERASGMPKETQASRARKNMESACVILAKWKNLEKHFLNVRKTPGNSPETRARCGGPRVVLVGRRMRPASSRVVRKAERPRPPSRHVAMCNTVAGRRRLLSGVWPAVSEGLACGTKGRRGALAPTFQSPLDIRIQEANPQCCIQPKFAAPQPMRKGACSLSPQE
jgi:hypothetical protein